MALEAEKLIEFLGYDPKTIDTEDKFKELVEKDYIKKAEAYKDETLVNNIVGRRVASYETAFKTAAKNAGIEWDKAELKDKKLEDIVDMTFQKVAGKFKEFESKSSQTNDEAIKEWQEKYTKLEAKASDYKKSWESTQTEFDGFKTSVDEEKKTGKVKQYAEQAWSGYKWPAGIDDLKKEGFVSYIGKNYKIQLDEAGQPFVTDINGNRIKSGKKHGEFKSLDEILVEEGTAKAVYAVAPAPGQRATVLQQMQQQQQVQQRSAGRQIHPAALKAI